MRNFTFIAWHLVSKSEAYVWKICTEFRFTIRDYAKRKGMRKAQKSTSDDRHVVQKDIEAVPSTVIAEATCQLSASSVFVLIAEDGERLDMLDAASCGLGCAVKLTFIDAEEIVRYCELAAPDLLIVDLAPDNEEIFLKEIRRNFENAYLPILVVTAADAFSRNRAFENGATDVIPKTLDSIEFLARSRNAIALKRGQQAIKEGVCNLVTVQKRAALEVPEQELDTLHRLSAAASFRDPETGGHLTRMSHYARILAKTLGTNTEYQKALFHAAPMHDIGKVGIPDYILLKNGRLTSDEMIFMKKHSDIGYQILRDSGSPFMEMAAIIAWTHHEKFDGSGYPRGLKGKHIPLAGRIVAVADVFDALTSSRPYKRAWSVEDSVAFLLSHRGTHFDPECVDAFVDILPEILEAKFKLEDGCVPT